MKTHSLKIAAMALLAGLFLACSAQSKISGTASDRTGTNGATNGTGKIARGL